MAGITYTTEIIERIEEQRRDRVRYLAGQAQHFTVTPDHVIPGAWQVRNPRIAGTVEIVLEDGSCSCKRSRIWGACKHAARVAEIHGQTWPASEAVTA